MCISLTAELVVGDQRSEGHFAAWYTSNVLLECMNKYLFDISIMNHLFSNNTIITCMGRFTLIPYEMECTSNVLNFDKH